MSDGLDTLATVLANATIEAATAIAPIGALTAAYHVFNARARQRLRHFSIGLAFAFIGLMLFLAGVELAFIPAGEQVASEIARRSAWWLVPVGFVLGSVATIAEPAVRIMQVQIERASGGAISGKLVVGAIALGVGAVVALAMARVILDFPLWWIVLPGYALVFAIAPLSDPRFVGMAFDSGGAASGPMAVTFMLSLAVGAAQQLPGRDPATMAFGMVALIALAPILTVLSVGVAYRHAPQANKQEREG
ncbi:MAG: DUF1538 domain-containing protein, partial [Gaiellales bacterium]